ncbi:hypothetical protein QYF61_023542 [Mycteria americana]|uniref:Uncharacterized protein n=1 Tax=Mycteria americana TaxID=33587 RepID=A0AAN7PLV1_MYCAM|nr:hypothetical protein QYF61_023542 [Mycteria americana]
MTTAAPAGPLTSHNTFVPSSGGRLYHLGAIFKPPTEASKINIVTSSSVPTLQNCQILSPHRNKTVKAVSYSIIFMKVPSISAVRPLLRLPRRIGMSLMGKTQLYSRLLSTHLAAATGYTQLPQGPTLGETDVIPMLQASVKSSLAGKFLKRSDYQDRRLSEEMQDLQLLGDGCLLWSHLTPMTFYYNKALLTPQCVLIMKDSEIHFSMEVDFRRGSGLRVKEPGALLQQCNSCGNSHLSAAEIKSWLNFVVSINLIYPCDSWKVLRRLYAEMEVGEGEMVVTLQTQVCLWQKHTGSKHHQRVRALYRWAQIILRFSGPEPMSVMEQSEGWRHNHFPGQPVPMLDNPFSEEEFPNIQSKPPLAQLEAISSCPVTCYLGEETDPHLSTASFQVVVESDEVSPQPPFLQAKQPQFPQLLLIRLLLQTVHQLRCPSLDTLQHLNVSLVVGGPKLNTGFEVQPHRCRVQGHDRFPSPAGHAIFDTRQDAIGVLGHLGTLLAHIQVAVNQHPQVLFCLAAFQPLFPKPVALHGVAVAQVQDLALGLVKPHTIGLGPLIQPVQVPLQSLPLLKQINTPTQLGVICKLTEGALDPFVQIIDKDVKQNWPQHRALGNTACDRPPTGVNSIHHHSLGPAVQPVLYPAKSTPVQAMSSQILQENAVGNRVKGFTEV